MAQAGDGTGRSHWHAGYPKSLAVSSKPMNDKIASELHILLMVPFQTGNFRMEYMNCCYQTLVELLSKCQGSKYQ